MGNRSKSKKAENFGKGKVTPVQVAFIVDRYLSDNNYPGTRSIFRTEASSLIAKSPIQEAPKSLLSLGAMLDEYICLKEQKVMMEQERVRLEQEKCRVQTLLQGMQSVMNSYNVSGSLPAPNISAAATGSVVLVPPQPVLTNTSPSGWPVHITPTVNPVSTPSNTIMKPGNFSTPITDPSGKKRKDINVVSAATKRSRSKLPARRIPSSDANTVSQSNNAVDIQEIGQPSSAIQSSPPDNCLLNGQLIQGSSVAKCLFNQPSLSIPSNSSGPKTPPRANSSQSDKSNKSTSPLEISSTANCSNSNTPQEITPTHCTVFSSKRVTVSPNKQLLYTMERSHCISSSSPIKTNLMRQTKRDHVKGRLDFDGSDVPTNSGRPIADEISTSTSESEKEMDIFDIDLPNLDAFGDFSFTEMLDNLDFNCEGIDFSSHPNMGASIDTTLSGSSHESMDGNIGANQVISEFSSTVTEVLSEKGMNIQGPDSLTSVKSLTKCVTILSPVKSRSYLDQENCSARN